MDQVSLLLYSISEFQNFTGSRFYLSTWLGISRTKNRGPCLVCKLRLTGARLRRTQSSQSIIEPNHPVTDFRSGQCFSPSSTLGRESNSCSTVFQSSPALNPGTRLNRYKTPTTCPSSTWTLTSSHCKQPPMVLADVRGDVDMDRESLRCLVWQEVGAACALSSCRSWVEPVQLSLGWRWERQIPTPYF